MCKSIWLLVAGVMAAVVWLGTPDWCNAEDAAPEWADPQMTSDDAEYGYSQDKPIQVGSPEENGGPAAEREYFRGLLDADRKSLTFQRIGSFGAGSDGHIIDGYKVTDSRGKTVTLFIDMYHPDHAPDKQLAPKGFYRERK